MGTIKGQNLRVMVGGKCIAMATSVPSTSALSWRIVRQRLYRRLAGAGGGQAELGCTVRRSRNPDRQRHQWRVVTDLMSLMINKTLVTLTFDQTGGTNNRTGQNAAIKRTGSASSISDNSHRTDRTRHTPCSSREPERWLHRKQFSQALAYYYFSRSLATPKEARLFF